MFSSVNRETQFFVTLQILLTLLVRSLSFLGILIYIFTIFISEIKISNVELYGASNIK